MSFGLYIHIPFCRRICPYCAFNVVRAKPSLPQEALLTGLTNEARARLPWFRGPMRTVYFGGGTPSLMPPDWIGEVLRRIRSLSRSAPQVEVTVEVEPETMDEDALRVLKAVGVNRLSIGWQSSVPRVLRALGRTHDAEAASRLVSTARRAGFDNISVDWMLAAPEQTDAEFLRDADRIVELQPDHVSCYVLTVEPKTPFARLRDQRKLILPGEDAEARWLTAAARTLGRAGLRRYEVASFARSGRQSHHNRAYWSGRPYLGLGPGAHSFHRHGWRTATRWMGHKSLQRYLARWQTSTRQSVPLREGTDFLEQLTPHEVAFERVLVGLRRCAGLSLRDPALKPFPGALARLVRQLEERQWARVRAARLRPTATGLLHADAAALLWQPEGDSSST